MGLDTLPEIMTISELTKLLKVSESTIRRAISSGDLKSFKVGTNVRIEKEAVKEWIEKSN